jgi:hypothetical protein
MKFPEHKCGLSLEHNANKEYYQSVEDYLDDDCGGSRFQFKDDDSRARCIQSKELWTLQWYPDTPVGFIAVAAPTLDELLDFANSGESKI